MTDENRQGTSKESKKAEARVWDMPEQGEVLERQEGANDGSESHPLDERQIMIQPTALSEPDLGATIRKLREGRQLSLKEVAARSGLTQSFLSQVERNLTSPSVASLRKVALAFGVPLTALFQWPAMPENRVVRRSERRQLIHPSRQ